MYTLQPNCALKYRDCRVTQMREMSRSVRGILSSHTGYEQNAETSALVSFSPIKWWRCCWHSTVLLWRLKIKQSKCLVESWHSYYLLNIYITMPFLLFFFWPYCEACGILVPWPGIEPGPPAMKVLTPNHWTTREVRVISLYMLTALKVPPVRKYTA